MDFCEILEEKLERINSSRVGCSELLDRVISEINFAKDLLSVYPDKSVEWEPIILEAVDAMICLIDGTKPIELEPLVDKVEEILSPIGKAAKEFTIYCAGHAHIDMNWLWPWQDTVSVTHDTFTTVDRLMDEFPQFKFSQSQASTYMAMEEYCPEVFEKVAKRISEGRWECTASMWVEGDKNLASGEIICRNMLYTRRYLKDKFGLPYEAVKIDWECDTFGHPHTLPAILNKGGVTRYYRHRTRPEHWLIWWKAPDGSKVLAYYDKATYNGPIDCSMLRYMLDFYRDTGLKDFLFVYGVGDHGGGPTRRDLIRAIEYSSWPIFPNIRFSTTDEWFSVIEPQAANIPVVDDELNYVFEGCYTSQSSIKLANRVSENILPEVEVISLAAETACGFKYPHEHILKGWRLAMFNQFHDILPGSGVHATYEYAQGLFQEIQAICGSIRTRALRLLASSVNTAAVAGDRSSGSGLGSAIGDGIGAGAGDPSLPGGVSAWNAGASDCEPVLVFNQLPFSRKMMVEAKIWNKSFPSDRIVVRDDAGNENAAQVLKKGEYWGHNYTQIVFPVDVPPLGYRVYSVTRSAKPSDSKGVEITHSPSEWPYTVEWLEIKPPVVIENEYLRLEIDMASGAIKSLIEKSSGYEFVPDGTLIGFLELYHEAPRPMSAWEIGQITRVTPLIYDGKLEIINRGPNRASVRTTRKLNESIISVEVGLDAGSRIVDFTVNLDWLERGTPEIGVPMLKMAFPVRVSNPRAIYEIPFGTISRPVNGQEVPALRWADIAGDMVESDGGCGVTVFNDCKYGHSAKDNVLRLTLLRSSFDPDPLPEMGKHNMRIGVLPHSKDWTAADAFRYAASFNLPMNVVSTDVHDGSLPTSRSFAEVLTSNVILAAIKKPEDGDGIVLRLYEVEGKDTKAVVRLNGFATAGASAVETDLMECPLPSSTARIEGEEVSVNIPAYGIATVLVKQRL